ncbi:MAG TPA: alpha/beta fold hydrolase [Verrucomicrobiae bacterium]|jgi:proline iminopeptidase|nr:alpha/beta fold hydrolase [Verrucomicrobiae bacterium]
MTPDEHTNQELFLDVGDGHQLYIQDWGNPKAKTPIIFLHGGPGSGCKDTHKQLFDPKIQRVIFHDQRGAGKSLPYGSIEHNTTAHLVEDIQKLHDHLKLTQAIIVGGSWGSCLALAYAIKHRSKIKAMVLHGIVTNSKQETEWLTGGAFRSFFPDAWQTYLDATPKSHHANPSAYHFKRILGDDEQASFASAKAFMDMDLSAMQLDDRYTPKTDDTFDGTNQRIEAHYFSNNCFLPENYIHHNTSQLTVPIYLINGRYDMICPPQNAYTLHHLLPNSELIWTISSHRNEHEDWNIIRTLAKQLSQEG